MIEGKIPETRPTITIYIMLYTLTQLYVYITHVIDIATNGEKLSFEELSFYI